MQPSDSLPPVGRGSGRPWPVAYPVPRATRRKKGLPGAWAVLFQRAVGSDPAGCASRLAHRVETAIAFRLHNALGTQNERYFVAVNPTAHSLACLRIGVFVTADAARLATGVGGSPFTGRVSHPLDGKQSFMTSPHRHSPLTSLAWSHRAPTPPRAAATSRSHRRPRVARVPGHLAGRRRRGELHAAEEGFRPPSAASQRWKSLSKCPEPFRPGLGRSQTYPVLSSERADTWHTVASADVGVGIPATERLSFGVLRIQRRVSPNGVHPFSLALQDFDGDETLPATEGSHVVVLPDGPS